MSGMILDRLIDAAGIVCGVGSRGQNGTVDLRAKDNYRPRSRVVHQGIPVPEGGCLDFLGSGSVTNRFRQKTSIQANLRRNPRSTVFLETIAMAARQHFRSGVHARRGPHRQVSGCYFPRRVHLGSGDLAH